MVKHLTWILSDAIVPYVSLGLYYLELLTQKIKLSLNLIVVKIIQDCNCSSGIFIPKTLSVPSLAKFFAIFCQIDFQTIHVKSVWEPFWEINEHLKFIQRPEGNKNSTKWQRQHISSGKPDKKHKFSRSYFIKANKKLLRKEFITYF